jgi:hypothetical protein
MKLEVISEQEKRWGVNFGSTLHRHLMQGKAQVKLGNRALQLCDDPVGEKILNHRSTSLLLLS